MTPKPTRPRTKGEREAFLTGFAQAILMIDNDGRAAAQAWLKEMAEPRMEEQEAQHLATQASRAAIIATFIAVIALLLAVFL